MNGIDSIASFSYKFWLVFIEEVFGTLYKINFTIDSFRILEACTDIAKKNNLQDDW